MLPLVPQAHANLARSTLPRHCSSTTGCVLLSSALFQDTCVRLTKECFADRCDRLEIPTLSASLKHLVSVKKSVSLVRCTVAGEHGQVNGTRRAWCQESGAWKSYASCRVQQEQELNCRCAADNEAGCAAAVRMCERWSRAQLEDGGWRTEVTERDGPNEKFQNSVGVRRCLGPGKEAGRTRKVRSAQAYICSALP